MVDIDLKEELDGDEYPTPLGTLVPSSHRTPPQAMGLSIDFSQIKAIRPMKRCFI